MSRLVIPPALVAGAALACIGLGYAYERLLEHSFHSLGFYVTLAAVPLLAFLLAPRRGLRYLFVAAGSIATLIGLGLATVPPADISGPWTAPMHAGMVLLFLTVGILLIHPRGPLRFRVVLAIVAVSALVLTQYAIVGEARLRHYDTRITVHNASGFGIHDVQLTGQGLSHGVSVLRPGESFAIPIHLAGESVLAFSFRGPTAERRIKEAAVLTPGDRALVIVRRDLGLTAKVTFARPAPSGITRISFVEAP